MCHNWHVDLSNNNSMMGGFCDPLGYSLSLLLSSCKIKGRDKGDTGTSVTGIIQCHPVEWLMASPLKWRYITSAVSYFSGRVINQPAQSHQLGKFSLSCSECSSFLLLCPPVLQSFLLRNRQKTGMIVSDMMVARLPLWMIHSWF